MRVFTIINACHGFGLGLGLPVFLFVCRSYVCLCVGLFVCFINILINVSVGMRIVVHIVVWQGSL